MANFYTRFGVSAGSTKTDAELYDDFRVNGIPQGEVAYTNVLNGILKQLSTATYALADFVATETGANVTSDSFTTVLLNSALDAWVGGYNFAFTAEMPFRKSDSARAQVKVWVGTENEYNSLTPDPDTLYFIH